MTRRCSAGNSRLGTSHEHIAGNLKSASNSIGRILPADLHPQPVPAAGTVTLPGFQLDRVIFIQPLDPSVNVLAANILFHSDNGFHETTYSPAVQGLVGVKLFLIKNLTIFGEVKRTTGWNKFDYEDPGAPPGFYKKFAISSNHCVAGVALHFLASDGGKGKND